MAALMMSAAVSSPARLSSRRTVAARRPGAAQASGRQHCSAQSPCANAARPGAFSGCAARGAGAGGHEEDNVAARKTLRREAARGRGGETGRTRVRTVRVCVRVVRAAAAARAVAGRTYACKRMRLRCACTADAAGRAEPMGFCC